MEIKFFIMVCCGKPYKHDLYPKKNISNNVSFFTTYTPILVRKNVYEVGSYKKANLLKTIRKKLGTKDFCKIYKGFTVIPSEP